MNMKELTKWLSLRSENDVNGLHKFLLDRLRDGGPGMDVNMLLKHILDDLRHDKEWVRDRIRAMRDEAERIALIGDTMKRAGLRSYTDEKGRIFVAS